MKNSIIIFLFFLTIIACQKKSDEIVNEKSFKISDVWMRPGVENRNSAAFMKIVNYTDIDDTLLSVSSDLAQVVELHETYTAENDMKGMRHIEKLIIPANSVVSLEPGSFHIMLIGLSRDFRKSDQGKVTLNFSVNNEIILPVIVK